MFRSLYSIAVKYERDVESRQGKSHREEPSGLFAREWTSVHSQNLHKLLKGLINLQVLYQS